MFSFLRKQNNTVGPSVKRVYLDNAGATEVGARAKRALLDTLDTFGNPSGIHHEGATSGKLLDTARALCAESINAHSYELYFMSSGTESCNLAVLGVYEGALRTWNKETLPHIITSTIEHPAILEPISKLLELSKITVTYLPVYDDGIVRVDDVHNALTENTILISVMYANNEIGTIQPIKEIGRMLEEWKKNNGRTHTSYPYFHTDACQSANYSNLDVVRLRVHLMTVNSSKVYGPKGMALLYKREGLRIEPISYGGGQERTLRSGTENVSSAYAFGVALKEAVALRDQESKRLRILRDRTVEELTASVPDIVFYGAFDEYHHIKSQDRVIKHEKRLPNNINCRIPGISSEEIILRLDAEGFAVSHKSACASRETDGSYVITALGASEKESLENIRISMGRSTTDDDMKRFVQAIKKISHKYRALE